jgi:ornithine cyclodeaminase
MSVTILTEEELRQCVQLDLEAVDEIEDGFSRLAQGYTSVPPIMAIMVPEHHGEVDVKSAYVGGLDGFAIKIASGFYENAKRGLPTGSGMMVVISATTGFPEAVLLDNGYLTDLRTGAAGAVAARHMARKNIETAGVIGSGVQARYQMRGLKLVRDFKRVLIYGIVPEQVEQYVPEMREELGVEVIAAPDVESVVREADVVVTTTPARAPFVEAAWLHPGLHITAMGSDMEDKQELHADVMGQADLVVCDRKSQCLRLGELHHAIESGGFDPGADIAELGDVTSGQRPGRTSDEQITVCDLTGVGVQDTMIALLAYGRAQERGMGLQL